MQHEPDQQSPGAVAAWRARQKRPPGLGLAWAAFFFLMIGMGWLPESILKIPGLYSISVGEILLAIAVARSWRFINTRRTGLEMVVTALIMAVTINVVRNVVEGYPALDVIRNARRMLYYSFFFVLVGSLSDRASLERAINWFTALFILGATSYLITAALDLPLGSRISQSDSSLTGQSFDRIYHIIFPMAVVVGFVQFAFLLLRVRSKQRVPPLVAFAVATLMVYLSYYRNYYVSYAVGLLVILLSISRLNVKRLARAVILSGTLIVVVLVGISLTGGLGRTVERALSIGTELTDMSGTFASRLIIWHVRYDTIRNINLVLGAGFIWEHDPDRTADDVALDPLVPDNDNGYAAALVILGFAGIALFTLLYVTALVLAWRLRSRPLSPLELALAHSVVGLVPYVLLNSIGLDNFHWPFAVLPNITLLAAISAISAREGSKNSPKQTQPSSGVVSNAPSLL